MINRRERTNKKGKINEKICSFFFSCVIVLNSCDEAEMRAALDRATRDNRAVITIVECDNGVVRTTTKPRPVPAQPAPVMARPACDTCGCINCGTQEEVVKREYFVRETVQQYKPVVQYVPAGTYTRVKPTCTQGC